MISIMGHKKSGLPGWQAAFVWIALWQLAALALDDGLLLAGPAEVLFQLARLLPSPEFWRRIGFSSLRMAGGFLLAAAAGVLLAAASAASPAVRSLVRPPMLLIRATPVASFIILALLWVKSRNLSLLISFLMVLPVIYSAVLEGFCSTDPGLLEMARVFRLPFSARLRAIWLPAAWPYFLQSCRVGLGLCWKSGAAAEVIGLPGGSIGEALYNAKLFLETGELFAWTLVIVLLSAGFERLFLWAVGRLGKSMEGGGPA